MQKTSITIDNLVGLSSNMKSKANSYDPLLIRRRRNRWVYKVGDYLVRIFVPKLSIREKKTITSKELKQKQKIKDRDVYVSCTCKYWKWNGPDFNANNQGYSERTFSNLESPDVRDPNRENLICKHVYAVLKHFNKNVKFVE